MKPIEDTTVLVVDDDKFNVTLMRELCQSIGYSVMEASDGFEALRKVRRRRPDIILLDLMMTGKNGFEVCQELKSDSSTADIPIIIVTALDDLESKMRGIKLGADDYVTKPFRLFELQQRISSVLEARHYRRLLDEAKRKLRRQGDFDIPGRVGGYRQLRNGLEYEFRRAQRYDHPLSAILLEVCGYDDVREKQGRKKAAAMISEMVLVLRGCLRSVDRLYRIGKDQFIVMLPETSNGGAQKALERVSERLRNPSRKDFSPIEVIGKVVTFPDGEIQSAGDMLMKLGRSGGLRQEW